MLSSTTRAADVLKVPAEYPTIQAAVGAAEDGDLIRIAAGDFTLDLPLDPLGERLEIRGTVDAEGEPATRLDEENDVALLRVDRGENRDTFIRNLVFTTGPRTGSGGLARIIGSSSMIENCEFRGGGVLDRRGAIFIDDSSRLDLEHCRNVDNSALVGGGVYENGAPAPEQILRRPRDRPWPRPTKPARPRIRAGIVHRVLRSTSSGGSVLKTLKTTGGIGSRRR